jgi:SPP1 family predicted phage head-tail adaptor
MGIGHLLNRTLAVWRPDTADDGAGGQTVTLVEVGDVLAKVDQPTAAERQQSDQWGAEHSHTIYLLFGADVERGDELRGGGQTFRVLATMKPSRSTYLKAPAQLVQSEPGLAES